MSRRSFLNLEALETRDAPATLVSPTKLTYQDVDGDNVTVLFSKPLLNAGNADSVFSFSVDKVSGDNSIKQQLRAIDLTILGAAANGVSITTTAVASPTNGGDGFAAVGQVIAPVDLGPVSIDGDLGRIVAGDGVADTTGLKGLTVQSMGRYGTMTGAPELFSVVIGRLDFVKVKADVKAASISVQGDKFGTLGSVFIGGSLIGDTQGTGQIASSGDMGPVSIQGSVIGGWGADSGLVLSAGKMAGVTIGGSLVGGGGMTSGRINCYHDIAFVNIAGDMRGGTGLLAGRIDSYTRIGNVRIGGSLVGGLGDESAEIMSADNMGVVTIVGDLVGGGGSGSGAVMSRAKLAGIRVGGSVHGASGNSSGRIASWGDLGLVSIGGDLAADGPSSATVSSGGRMAGVHIGGSVRGSAAMGGGRIISELDMGQITIGGDLVGGGYFSGQVSSDSKMLGVRIGGSVRGGAGSNSGFILAYGDAGSIVIGHDLIGGNAGGSMSLTESGFIRARRLANLTIGGSLIAGVGATTGQFELNGAVSVENDIGTVLIGGSLLGNATNPAIISARGQAIPSATADMAIGSVRVLGNVEYGFIRAGFDLNGYAMNADAQIGTVTVGGDWIASNLVAGANPGGDGWYGNSDDYKMKGVAVDQPTRSSRIASLTIAGEALGTPDGVRHFGVVAQSVGAVKIGGTPLVLHAGDTNDNLLVGITSNFRVREV
jgi:hypothetical protein